MLRHAVKKEFKWVLRYRTCSRNYSQIGPLSENFKATMDHRFENPQIDHSIIKKFGQSNDLLPFDLEHFITTTYPAHKHAISPEDRRDELYEKLIRLRESSISIPQTLNHSVVNYLSVVNIDDLLAVLSNKLRYGIFIDAFSGCYLMNLLLKKNNFQGAVQIGAELMLQEDNNDLVRAFSLLSSFEFIKQSINDFKSWRSKQSSENVEKKTTEKLKSRVKFIRNPTDNEILNTANVDSNLISTILITTCSRSSQNRIIKENGKFIASLIDNNLLSSDAIINESKDVLCKDVIELCLSILDQIEGDRKKIQSIKVNLEVLKESSCHNYLNTLKDFVQKSVDDFEAEFVKQRNELYKKWLRDRNEQLVSIVKNQTKQLHEENILKDLSYIKSKRQELWFFETQDLIDMEIFRKQVRYPKRWFGKKKKPRMVDDNYVPPEIRNKA